MFTNARPYAGYEKVRVLSVVPPLVWAAVGDSELQGKNHAYMGSSMGKMRCSFAVVAGWVSVVGVVAVASTSAVAGAVEVDSFAVAGAELGGFALEMVPRRSCCDWFAVAGTIEGVRSAAWFGYNMLRFDLP